MPLLPAFREQPEKRYVLLLAIAWMLVQAILFFQYGIETSYEARKYIEEADILLAKGTVSSPNFWLYSVQIFLIAAFKWLHWGYFPVVVIQWFFNGWATLALYRFLAKTTTPLTSFIVTLLFVFNFPLQTFNSFLQTESLFHSFTILFSCYLLSREKLTWKNFSWIFLLLLLISITRPTGLLWFPCAFLFLFFRFFRGFATWKKLAITVAASIAFLWFLNTALGSGGELDFMLPFRDERIICGVPTLPGFVDIDVSDNPNSITGIWYYITHNFAQFARLAWLRTLAFFGLSRSYYSSGHNLYLYIYFFPVYLLAFAGVFAWIKRNRHLLLYCFGLIGLTWLTVILTCDDWHNRFFLTIVPYIYILAAPAVEWVTRKFKKA